MDKLNFLRALLGPELQRGQEYLFFCPNRCHLERPKLSINIEKGVYKCWKCGYSGHHLRNFILQFFRGSISEWNKLDPPQQREVYDTKTPVEEDVGWIFKGLSSWPRMLAHTSEEAISRKVRQYLNKKKISQHATLQWNVRISDSHDTLLVPSFNLNGDPNYYVQKTCSDEFTVAKRPGVSQKNVIFNEFAINWSKPVYLVENVFDSMRFPFGSVIPLLGSSVKQDSRLISEAVMNQAELVVFLDSDEVGVKRSFELHSLLTAFGINAKIVDNQVGDIDEMEDWQLQLVSKMFLSDDQILKRRLEGILDGVH